MIGTIAKLWGAAALVAGASLFAETAAEQPPVPSSETGQENAGGKMAGNLLSGTLMPQIPSNISITNDGAIRVEESRKVIFEGPHVHMVTDTGVEVFADYAQADMDQGKVFLKGNLAIYQSDGRTRTNSLVRADSAEFDWENEVLLTDAIRAKMEGLILRSGKFESRKDAAGNTYLEARNASVTAEDISEPLTWISADRIRVYPEDRFSFKNLTLYYGGVPFFYFPYLSHSLNPEVGYLPIPGMRSIWGPYLLNEYGFLMGKKWSDNGMPSADYLGTLHADYRTRRGFAYGLDIRDVLLEKDCPDMTGDRKSVV